MVPCAICWPCFDQISPIRVQAGPKIVVEEILQTKKAGWKLNCQNPGSETFGWEMLMMMTMILTMILTMMMMMMMMMWWCWWMWFDACSTTIHLYFFISSEVTPTPFSSASMFKSGFQPGAEMAARLPWEKLLPDFWGTSYFWGIPKPGLLPHGLLKYFLDSWICKVFKFEEGEGLILNKRCRNIYQNMGKQGLQDDLHKNHKQICTMLNIFPSVSNVKSLCNFIYMELCFMIQLVFMFQNSNMWLFQWSFLVPLSPKWYISGIYCQFGDYNITYHLFFGNVWNSYCFHLFSPSFRF